MHSGTIKLQKYALVVESIWKEMDIHYLIIAPMHMRMIGGMKPPIVGLGFVVLMMIMMSLQSMMSGKVMTRIVDERRRFIT
jgi:hypothetical protein